MFLKVHNIQFESPAGYLSDNQQALMEASPNGLAWIYMTGENNMMRNF